MYTFDLCSLNKKNRRLLKDKLSILIVIRLFLCAADQPINNSFEASPTPPLKTLTYVQTELSGSSLPSNMDPYLSTDASACSNSRKPDANWEEFCGHSASATLDYDTLGRLKSPFRATLFPISPMLPLTLHPHPSRPPPSLYLFAGARVLSDVRNPHARACPPWTTPSST